MARTGSIQVTVSKDIKAEQLHQALYQILRFGGCVACGLVGIDLNFRLGDPGPEELRKTAGITGVLFAGH